MINFSYYIRRNEKNRNREFTPLQIPLELPNLVYIEGPNSSGKSTLLHILALGFNGLSDGYIIKAPLKDKMKNLIDSNHQQVTFEISITDKDNNVVLRSQKKNLDSDEIIVRDRNNKPIVPDDFIRKYKLIYDIPENPTERLKDLLHEIEDMQVLRGKRIGTLQRYLDDTIKDIKEARDPHKIEKKKKELQEMQQIITTNAREIESLDKALKDIRTYTALKYFTEHKEEYTKLKKCFEDLKRDDRQKRQKLRKVTIEYREKQKRLIEGIRQIKTFYNEVTPILKNFLGKKEKERIQIWQDINIEKEIRDNKLRKDLKIEALNFISLLKENRDKQRETSNEDLQKVSMYNQLIEFLENYKNLQLKLPGVEITIPKFIDALKKEYSKYEEITVTAKNINRAIELLDGLLKKRDEVIKIVNETMEAIEKKKATGQVEEYNEDEYKFEHTKERIKCAEQMMNFYKVECAKLDIKENDIGLYYESVITSKDFKPLRNYLENDLREKIANFNAEIDKKRADLEAKRDYVKHYLEPELKNLQNKKPHQFHKYLPRLEHLHKVILRMQQKLEVEFDDYIKELIERKNSNKRNISLEKQQYFDLVSEFLAKKIGFILHINETYELKKIDLIDGTILTTGGTEIKIKDMGTGQSQSAYLTALLSSTDNRKIIALFDEVAMMDKRSLQQVYDKLKELHEKEKLLIGVIVQKAEKLQVSQIV